MEGATALVRAASVFEYLSRPIEQPDVDWHVLDICATVDRRRGVGVEVARHVGTEAPCRVEVTATKKARDRAPKSIRPIVVTLPPSQRI